MNRQDVIDTIQVHSKELRENYGVSSLSLFGSVARNEAKSTSDIDLLVEFYRPVGLFGLFALQDRLEEIFKCNVDLGTMKSLKPRIRSKITTEIIHVT